MGRRPAPPDLEYSQGRSRGGDQGEQPVPGEAWSEQCPERTAAAAIGPEVVAEDRQENPCSPTEDDREAGEVTPHPRLHSEQYRSWGKRHDKPQRVFRTRRRYFSIWSGSVDRGSSRPPLPHRIAGSGRGTKGGPCRPRPVRQGWRMPECPG
jgi:hypothetical protein